MYIVLLICENIILKCRTRKKVFSSPLILHIWIKLITILAYGKVNPPFGTINNKILQIAFSQLQIKSLPAGHLNTHTYIYIYKIKCQPHVGFFKLSFGLSW